MQTIKVLYLNVLDIGCYSHTIDHVGGCFETPTAHFPNLHAVARKLSAIYTAHIRWICHYASADHLCGKSCIQSGLDYFVQVF